ncbi:hypothetical protein [Lacihabitans lacunae]|uniref:Uncharacterized protein n=1 Tax=Lacihabitans lacunae TaxID=1028214 RepID=A0ABV7Z527_9BACT
MSNSEIIIYDSADEVTNIEPRLGNKAVWLTQAQRPELFGKGRTTITDNFNASIDSVTKNLNPKKRP